jgi:hypothetical protein
MGSWWSKPAHEEAPVRPEAHEDEEVVSRVKRTREEVVVETAPVMQEGVKWFRKFERSRFCVHDKTDCTLENEPWWTLYLLARVPDCTIRLMKVCLSFKHKTLKFEIIDHLPIDINIKDKVLFLEHQRAIDWYGFTFQLYAGREPLLVKRLVPNLDGLAFGLRVKKPIFRSVQGLHYLIVSDEFESIRNMIAD